MNISPTLHSVSAPGKLILCGEHAVVYGYPAIALPVHGIRARVEVVAVEVGSGITFDAPDLGRNWRLRDAPDDPLSQVATAVIAHLGQPMPDLQLRITSDIPIASGMGSGAAIATVVVRALAGALGYVLSPDDVSALVYESEKRYHGTPSGIDNTVVAFEQPIWFVRGAKNQEPAEHLQVGQSPGPTITPIHITTPFILLIGDTGIRSATKLPVGEVRRRREAEPERYEQLFNQIGAIATRVRALLADGDITALGGLLTQNQELLQAVGVSSLELDRLVDVALGAGALGAKLSGAGWGGVMIALAQEDTVQRVQQALQVAGAVRVLTTRLERC